MATDYLFETAGETRKQKLAANALIMGLIPLTLRDISWPERRVVHLTQALPRTAEILVLGQIRRRTGRPNLIEECSSICHMCLRQVWRPVCESRAYACAVEIYGHPPVPGIANELVHEIWSAGRYIRTSC